MIIPTEHEFLCANDDDATMTVDVSNSDVVCFDTIDFDGEMAAIYMDDREQVTMLRDMLTSWLSRP